MEAALRHAIDNGELSVEYQPILRQPADLLAAAQADGSIDLAALGDDAAVREEALALAWERATGHVLTARHRSAIAAQLARGEGRGALDLPGGRLVRERALVRIELVRPG